MRCRSYCKCCGQVIRNLPTVHYWIHCDDNGRWNATFETTDSFEFHRMAAKGWIETTSDMYQNIKHKLERKRRAKK